MSKSASRLWYLLGLVVTIVGTILVVVGAVSARTATSASGQVVVTNPGNTPLIIVGIILIIIGSIAAVVGWVGALVRTAQLQRWAWFICLLVFSGITMLLYIFIGPETPAPTAQQTPAARY